MNTAIRAIFALLTLTTVTAIPAAGLAPYQATYTLSYGGFTAGEALYELEIDGDGMVRFHARVEPRGLASLFTKDIVREESRLRLEDDGTLVALYYEYEQESNRRTIESKSIEFDWSAGEARTRVDDERRSVTLEPGAVDRMSLQLRVMTERLADNDARELVYPVVEDHELREFRFLVRDDARITTPAGDYDTVRLERRHGSRTTIFWIAPSLANLPVRVEQRRDGYPTSRMELRRITGSDLGN